MKLSLQFLALVAFAAPAWTLRDGADTSATQPDQLAASSEASQASEERSARNAPLGEHQDQLLSLAFDAASKFPLDPHVKNRSRAQEAAVVAALRLDQPERARAYAAHIANWRRGSSYADIAYYCAQRGALADIQSLLQLAAQEAEGTEEELGQVWRRDRIRVKVARVHAYLGNDEQAQAFESGVVESETGKVAPVRAAILGSDAELDAELEGLKQVVMTGALEQVQATMEAYVELYERFYTDEERRARIEDAILFAAERVPLQVRIENLLALADVSIEQADHGKALRLVDEAQAFLQGDVWRSEHKVPLMARIASRRYRAGETEKAMGEVEAALVLFEKDRELIYDVFRAETLRPVAEAFQVMGRTPAALSVYRSVIEEGALNPNSRPRCEDLVATACSMAVSGLEPDAELWKRMRAIADGLGDPW